MRLFAKCPRIGPRLHKPHCKGAVAFFSSCSACQERVQPFASYLRAGHLARDSALVVSVGPGSAPLPYLDELAGLARICVEQAGGEIGTAFKVNAFPAFTSPPPPWSLIASRGATPTC